MVKELGASCFREEITKLSWIYFSLVKSDRVYKTSFIQILFDMNLENPWYI